MTPAATRLAQSQWRDALPDEQKALQHLLRAEATFRQIQVAFGSAGGGGGGGGGGGSMGRDLASLSDLELDTQKNNTRPRSRPRPPSSGTSRSTPRCASSMSWRASRRNWRRSIPAARMRPVSAGSRKCCVGRPRNCNVSWNSWRETDKPGHSRARNQVRRRVNRDSPGSQASPVNPVGLARRVRQAISRQ